MDETTIKSQDSDNKQGETLKRTEIDIRASNYLKSQVALDVARARLQEAQKNGVGIEEAAALVRPLFRETLTKKQSWLEARVAHDTKIVGDSLTDRDIVTAIGPDGKLVPNIDPQVKKEIEQRKGRREELWQMRLASEHAENYKIRLYNAYEIAQARLEGRPDPSTGKIAREMVTRMLERLNGDLNKVVIELQDNIDERKTIEMRKSQLRDALKEVADIKMKLGDSSPEKVHVLQIDATPVSKNLVETKSGNPYDLPVREVSEEERDEIIAKTEVHGDPFQDKALTPELLKEMGLSPKYKVEGTEGNIWLSSSGYNLDSGRIAVVGYVEYQGKTVARTFYRSNSQGVWRYLPNYRMAGNEVEWYGKGYGEESITLPIPLQKVLSEITNDESKLINTPNPWLAFAGTARNLHSKNTYRSEVNSQPMELTGNFYPSTPFDKVNPSDISFYNDQQAPDFSQKVTSWNAKTGLNGNVTVDVFRSKDKSLGYMFCRDAEGRCWIGGVDAEGEIQSTGLHRVWINAGDLSTPSYEYKTAKNDQTGGYGNDRKRTGHYVDMYDNYLSQVPVIQEYSISQVKDLQELFQVLDQLKQIPTSLGLMNSDEIKNAINLIGTPSTDGKIIAVDVVTSARGLRQKVISLLNL
jgi:hypothetical protein